ncbi:hypothetical protein C0J52_03034, partial [Blattella germanica]
KSSTNATAVRTQLQHFESAINDIRNNLPEPDCNSHYSVKRVRKDSDVRVEATSCLKCYLCNTAVDTTCGDPFRRRVQEPRECIHAVADYLTSAMGLESYAYLNTSFACMKIIFSDNSGRKLTMRGCTFSEKHLGDPCVMNTGIDKVIGEDTKVDFCGICENDLCNGSRSQFLSELGTILIPLISRFLIT